MITGIYDIAVKVVTRYLYDAANGTKNVYRPQMRPSLFGRKNSSHRRRRT